MEALAYAVEFFLNPVKVFLELSTLIHVGDSGRLTLTSKCFDVTIKLEVLLSLNYLLIV